MGKIVSLINTTPDGFTDARYTVSCAEFYEFSYDILHTFELFQNLWPARLESETATEWQIKLAQKLTDMPKVVYSSTLKTTTWANTTIAPKIDIENINAYKHEGKKGLMIHGSMQLVSALTKLKLIDEYYFCIQPHIAGMGSVRLFENIHLDAQLPLNYLGSKQLKSGVHIIHYQTQM
jgi:dihydrofolate reductase